MIFMVPEASGLLWAFGVKGTNIVWIGVNGNLCPSGMAVG